MTETTNGGAAYTPSDWQPKAYVSMQKAVEKSASAALTAAKAQQTLAKATQSAASALKNAISGFDELNIAAKASGSSKKGSSGKKTAAKEEEASALQKFIEALLARLDALCDKMRVLFAPAIEAWSAAFERISSALDMAFESMSAAAQSLWDNALSPLLSYILEEFIPGIVNAFSMTFAPIFADIAVSAIDTFANAFVTACAIIEDAVNALLLPAIEFIQQVFTDMCTAISNTWNEYGALILEQLSGVCDGILNIITQLYEGIIKPVLTNIGAALATLWNEHLKPLWQNLTDMLASAGAAISALLNNFIIPFISYLVGKLSPIITAVLTAAANTFTFLFGVAADVVSGISTALKGLCDFLTGVFTGDWSRAWEGVKQIFSGVWDGITAILKGAVNGIIGVINAMLRGISSGVNGVIGALNGINVTIPKWVPVYGGQSFGISLPKIGTPQIPMLARGAVIPANAEFLALLGDQKNGRNLEAPESLLRQIVREETGENGDLSLTAPLSISLDGDVLYVAMEKVRARRGAVIGGNFANAI